MRCGRCQDFAETKVNTRNFGTEDLCIPCARNVMADRQCDNILQPPQPPGLLDEVNKMRAEYKSSPLQEVPQVLYGFYSVQMARVSPTFIYTRPDGSQVVTTQVSSDPESTLGWNDVVPCGMVIHHVETIKPIGFTDIFKDIHTEQ